MKEKISQSAFKALTNEQRNLSKVNHLEFNGLKIQEYLLPNKLGLSMSRFVFLLRSRMLDVRCNYKNKYIDILCPLCKSDQDTQQHILVCSVLKGEEIVGEIPLYEYLWQRDTSKLILTASVLKKKFLRSIY